MTVTSVRASPPLGYRCKQSLQQLHAAERRGRAEEGMREQQCPASVFWLLLLLRAAAKLCQEVSIMAHQNNLVIR